MASLSLKKSWQPTPVTVTLHPGRSGCTNLHGRAGRRCGGHHHQAKIGLKQFLEDASKTWSQRSRRQPKPMCDDLRRGQKHRRRDHACSRQTWYRGFRPPTCGGTRPFYWRHQALELVLTSLPRVTPGQLIVQHMPEKVQPFAGHPTTACARSRSKRHKTTTAWSTAGL